MGERLLLLVAGIFVALAAAEGLLRLLPAVAAAATGPGDGGPFLWRHPDYPYFDDLRPGISFEVPYPDGRSSFTVQTNAYGLRRPTEVLPEHAGIFRVLVLGDSQTFGFLAYEETIGYRLEQLLGRLQPGEVLNAGLWARTVLEEYLWLRYRGPGLTPDLVIVVVFTGNDVRDLMDRGRARLADGDGERPRVDRGLQASAKQLLRSNSRLYWLLRNVLKSSALGPWLYRLGVVEAPDVAPAAIWQRDGSPCAGCVVQNLLQSHASQIFPAETEAALARLEQMLALLRDESRAQGARLLVAVLPSRLLVEPEETGEEMAAAAAALGLSREALGFEHRVRAQVLASLARLQVPAVDLLPSLRALYLETRQPLYYPLDWHLKPEGSAAVADFLLPQVRAAVLDTVR